MSVDHHQGGYERMDMETAPPSPSAPLSWRDVYRALGETEVRIVAAINQAVSPLNASVLDHETRLREIEKFGSHTVQSVMGTVESLQHRVAELERDDAALLAREKGILATLSAGQKFVLLLAAIVSAMLAMSHLLEGLLA